MNIKVLRHNTSCDEATQLVGWLKALLPAVENRWIDRITMALHDGTGLLEDPELTNETLIDTYTVRGSRVQPSWQT
jgi:hypothetical protein